MPPHVVTIFKAWLQAIAESRGVNVTVRLEDIKSVVAWAREAERRAGREARDGLTTYLRAQIPSRPGSKRSGMASCCAWTLQRLLDDLKRPR